jgi:tetratricopeptide (TPR) repeat protein
MRAPLLLVALVAATSVPASASPESRALTERGFDAAYNLDYERAVGLLQQAVAADANDADAHRAIAVTAWLRIGFLRGSTTVDDYLGNVTRPNINMVPPPAAEAARFEQHISRALALAEQDLRAQPNSTDAHFRLGSVVGVRASYGATVEGRVLASFRSARRAYDAHETVLRLDPSRKDAGLVVGTYRYIVSALSAPIRLMAYIAGFGGGREQGLRMIEEAAAYPSATQVDARFALVLFYNRERRYDEAMAVLSDLQRRFPRNRLLWLEAGATLIRAGRAREAEDMLNAGLDRLQNDSRERMAGEDALWYYKRAVARVRAGRREEAASDLDRSMAAGGREWVTGRAHAERGRLADLAGQREQARQEYRLAIQLAERGNDPVGKAEAEALLRTPYK